MLLYNIVAKAVLFTIFY